MNPLSLLGYDWSEAGDLTGGPSARSWTLAGLQGASSAAGILAQIGSTRAAGRSASQSAYMQAGDEFLNAQQAEVSGYGQVAGLRQQLMQTLGSRQAAAGAAGVDVGAGLVRDNAGAITTSNDTAAGVARSNAEIVSRRHRLNALASVLRGNQAGEEASRQASAQLGTGILNGLMSIGSMLLV